MPTKKIRIESADHALALFGHQDSNLRILEERFKISVFVKKERTGGDVSLVLKGPKKRVEKALVFLEDIASGNSLVMPNEPQADLGAEIPPEAPASSEALYISYQGRYVVPKSENQRYYVEAMKTSDIVIAIGPAGTGKTYLAVAYALQCLKNRIVSRIVLTRPVVEAGEKLGFLPGDLYEKLYPYLKPLYDAFYLMLGPEKFKALQVTETIEIVPLAYMRGRTLDDAFIILDEAQNSTINQMKMFLTRMGMGSKIVVTGDVTQVDLNDKQTSGLAISREILGNIPSIVFVNLTEADVVRHPLVKQVIRAYENWENTDNQSHSPR